MHIALTSLFLSSSPSNVVFFCILFNIIGVFSVGFSRAVTHPTESPTIISSLHFDTHPTEYTPPVNLFLCFNMVLFCPLIDGLLVLLLTKISGIDRIV